MIPSMYSEYCLQQVQTGRFADLKSALNHYAHLGLRTVQTFEDLHRTGLSAKEYRALFQSVGITPVCHTVFCSVAAATPEKYQSGVKKLEAELQNAADLGAEMLMVVPDPADILTLSQKPAAAERIIDTLNRLALQAADRGITLTIENYSAQKAPFQTPSECRHILNAVPSLRFVLDTGNFYWCGADILQAYELLKDKMIHVHVKDWALTTPDIGLPGPNGQYLRSVAPKKGVLNTPALLNRLKADGYQGSLVAEYNALVPPTDELDDILTVLREYQ